MIEERTIERVKAAASIVDVISDFIELKRDGQYWTCLCPFHNDQHLGSFKISPRHNSYTCYSCGEHGSPVDFLMNYSHLDFPDAIRYLGRKYGISVEGSDSFSYVKPAKARPAPKPLPTLELPVSMINARRDTSANTLCNWIRSLPWEPEQAARVERVLNNYLVGHSNMGHTIFWQVDQEGRVRTGKMMLYKPDGHRDKVSPHNHDWIHSRLFKSGRIDLDHNEVRQTLFGMHLLMAYPKAQVNIVESEKTAVLMAIAYGNNPQQVWMATGGIGNLSAERLAPIINLRRDIVLFPDRDAVPVWNERAKSIGYRMGINTSIVSKDWLPEDGPKADIADVIIRMMLESDSKTIYTEKSDNQSEDQTSSAKAAQIMAAKNPAFGRLIDQLELKPL